METLSKEKQIEEMKLIIDKAEEEYSKIWNEWFYDHKEGTKIDNDFLFFAKMLYDAGYRKQSEDCEKRIANQREEIRRLHKRINDLTYSRDVWKKQAERVGKQLNEVLSKQSKGEWVVSDIPQEKYVCSVCGGACWYYDYQGEVAKSRYCPNCGAHMR